MSFFKKVNAILDIYSCSNSTQLFKIYPKCY